MSGYMLPIVSSFSLGYFLSEYSNMKKKKEE